MILLLIVFIALLLCYIILKITEPNYAIYGVMGLLGKVCSRYLWEKSERNGCLQKKISSIWYVKCGLSPSVLSQHTAFVIIYAVILNLPRSESYIEEDVMVFRVIPGPSEPKLHLNTYLEPIVDDLQQLNNGIII